MIRSLLARLFALLFTPRLPREAHVYTALEEVPEPQHEPPDGDDRQTTPLP